MDKKGIGNAIKERRKQLGIGQEFVSDLAQVGVNTIVAIERGEGNPKLDTLLSLMRALGLTLTVAK